MFLNIPLLIQFYLLKFILIVSEGDCSEKKKKYGEIVIHNDYLELFEDEARYLPLFKQIKTLKRVFLFVFFVFFIHL